MVVAMAETDENSFSRSLDQSTVAGC